MGEEEEAAAIEQRNKGAYEKGYEFGKKLMDESIRFSKLEPVVDSVTYHIPLDGQLVGVEDLDWSGFAGEAFDPFKILSAVEGVSDVEYNGHFGNNVYFTAESDEARDNFRRVLHEVLEGLPDARRLIEEKYEDG